MTRKDYIRIAAALNAARPVNLSTDDIGARLFNVKLTTWDVVVANMADALKADNSRFDTARFVAACNGRN